MGESYKTFRHVGLALDPIHVGTGGARLGRVDLTIVRDPVTQIPKIPGSSLAGVHRAYAAMAQEARNPNRQQKGTPKPYYPDCAGLGQPRADGTGGHCAQPSCPICTVFGFARGQDAGGGFAGLAAFSDAHVLLFPVATRKGPCWVSSPSALGAVGIEVDGVTGDALYCRESSQDPLNLGWLLLPVEAHNEWGSVRNALEGLGVPREILDGAGLLSDRLFAHVVNSNLEVRTSVAIDPATGAAEEGALFGYEALPRATVLAWDVICKNPEHFRVGSATVAFGESEQQVTINNVHAIVTSAHPYLEHLGIGGMGTRGMGRLKVLGTAAGEVRGQEGAP